MFAIYGDEINVTRGDTAIIDVEAENYTFVEGDRVYFTVKRSKNDTESLIQKVVTVFEGNKAKIILLASDTKINKGKYWYDIQFTLTDGRVDTVVPPARFIVGEEVTNE